MEIVINSVATRVWRSETSLQIGLGSETVLLENLQPRHEALIHALCSGLTLTQARDYGRHLKMRAAETQSLINALKPVLLKNTERNRQTDQNGSTLMSELNLSEPLTAASVAEDSPLFQQALGEMNQASLKFASRGETVWLRRKKRAVFISNLDRTGQIIAESLADSGIGALISGDVNPLRLAATEQLIQNLAAKPELLKLTDLTQNQLARIDVAILLGQQLIEPQKFAAWMNRGTPQIGAVCASAAEKLKSFVSHVIVPGISPCWACLEISRCSSNPAWPQMASQIVGRELSFDGAASRLALASAVVEKTLDHIDHTNGFEKLPQNLMWEFSAECSCRLGAAQT